MKRRKKVEGLRQLDNQELMMFLDRNKGDEDATGELFSRLVKMKGKTGRGSNLAVAIFSDGHPYWLARVWKAVECFSKAGCFTPADFEGMIRARPEWRDRLVLLLEENSSSRATKQVVANAASLAS